MIWLKWLGRNFGISSALFIFAMLFFKAVDSAPGKEAEEILEEWRNITWSLHQIGPPLIMLITASLHLTITILLGLACLSESIRYKIRQEVLNIPNAEDYIFVLCVVSIAIFAGFGAWCWSQGIQLTLLPE